MRITQISLQGHGGWPDLCLDRIDPQLNVLFAPPRAGKSTVAHLAAHLLFGKSESSWRRQFAQSLPPAVGSLQLESPQGEFVLRRQRTVGGNDKLTITPVADGAVDPRTIPALLGGLSPQWLAQLLAVDFAERPSVARMLDEPFAGELTAGPADLSVANVPADQARTRQQVNRPRIDELVQRRDAVAGQIEQQIADRRQESSAVEQALDELDQALDAKCQASESKQVELRGVESSLAEIETRLRYFDLETAIQTSGTPVDLQQTQHQLNELDGEIGRCRAWLTALQAREVSLRTDLTRLHPDGTADRICSLDDQRATVGMVERLLDDLDAEIATLKSPTATRRDIAPAAYARLGPVSELLRQQTYTLCNQISEQQKTEGRQQLALELRLLNRSQFDLADQLEQLLARRERLAHHSRAPLQPSLQLAGQPAVDYCRCEQHEPFVRRASETLLAAGDQNLHQVELRSQLDHLYQQRVEIQCQLVTLGQEIEHLQRRWDELQSGRARLIGGESLVSLRSELSRLEAELSLLLKASQRREATPDSGDHLRASGYLAQLSGGGLVQIQLDRQQGAASFVSDSGSSLPLDALTAAQCDQLYLALTLAVVNSLTRRGIHLPLILDEPFLRQDQPQTTAMAAVLAKFARAGNQLLVLSEDRVAIRRFESMGVAVLDLQRIRQQPLQLVGAETDERKTATEAA